MNEPLPKVRRRQSGQPTIGDVARLAGCSPMTVSRVINNEVSVRAEAREKVLDAIQALNYCPNRAARSLAGAPQTRIAFLYSNPSASYLSELLMGCLDQARLSDITMVVERCEIDCDAVEVVGRLIDNGISGFLVSPPLCDQPGLTALFREKGAKVVLVGQAQAEANQTAVMIDEFQAAFDMTTHIIGLGHRRIGFIIGEAAQTASRERLRGFRAGMAAAGLDVPPTMLVQGQFTYRSGFAAAQLLLDQNEPPTAIFASNDDMAAGAIGQAYRRGLEVPRDLTVCGFDDTAMASIIWPELTTIRQPIAEMSRRGVELLAHAVRYEGSGKIAEPCHLLLDYTLIRRQSDAGPADAQAPLAHHRKP